MWTDADGDEDSDEDEAEGELVLVEIEGPARRAEGPVYGGRPEESVEAEGVLEEGHKAEDAGGDTEI